MVKFKNGLLKEIKNIVEYKNISMFLYDKDSEKFKFYLSENEEENNWNNSVGNTRNSIRNNMHAHM